MNERTTAEVSPPGGSSRCLGHRDSGEGDCGIKQMAYTGKTSETVGRKAMGAKVLTYYASPAAGYFASVFAKKGKISERKNMKKRIKKSVKRILAVLLVLVMCMSMVDVTTFTSKAEETDGTAQNTAAEKTEESDTSETVSDEQEEEPSPAESSETEARTPAAETSEPAPSEPGTPPAEPESPAAEAVTEKPSAEKAPEKPSAETVPAEPADGSVPAEPEKPSVETQTPEESVSSNTLSADKVPAAETAEDTGKEDEKEEQIKDLLSRIQTILAQIPDAGSLKGTEEEAEALNELGQTLSELYEECLEYPEDGRVEAAQKELADAIAGLQELLGLAAELLADEEADSALSKLKEAIASAKDGSVTIVSLAGDITGMKTEDIITIPGGKNIILNMDGHSITVAGDFTGRPFVNEGTLTITGNGTIDSSASEQGGYGAVNNKGTLTVENGIFKGATDANGACIRNTGASAVLVVKDGTFEKATSAIYNEGTATLHDGTYTGTTCSSCNSTVWSYTIRNVSEESHMVINGGTYTGTQGAVSAAVGYLEVNGGTFETVDCGEKHGAVFYALYAAGERGKVQCIINDGTFISGAAADKKRPAVLIGNDNTNGDGGINADAVSHVYGGDFQAAEGVSALKISENTAAASIIHGGTYSFLSEDIEKYLDPAVKTATAEDGTIQVVPRTAEDGDVKAKAGDACYTSLQEAVDKAEKGSVVTLLADEISESVTISEGKEIILDLNGKTLTGTVDEKTGKMSNVITNHGTLTIQDTAGKGSVTGGKDTGDGIALVNSEGAVCTVLSGTIQRKDDNTFGNYTVQNMGTMYIKGGLITNNSNASNLVVNFGNKGGSYINGYKAHLEISGGTLKQDLMSALKNDPGTYLKISGTATLIERQATNKPDAFACNLYGTVEMDGGSITTNGVIPVFSWKEGNTEFKSSFTITGGTINCNMLEANNGIQWSGTDGHAWVVNTPENYPVLTISGDAQINADQILAVTVLSEGKLTTVKNGQLAWIKISGGSFSKAVKQEYCVEGYGPVTLADGRYGVSKIEVAEVNGQTYPTLQSAIDAANGGIVKLLKDVNESVTVKAGVTAVLDLNSRTLTGAVDEKTGKMSNVITNQGTLTIKDSGTGGTIMGGTGTTVSGKLEDGKTNDPGRDGVALVNSKSGTCTVESGIIKRGDNGTFGNYTVKNEGTMEIAGGTITNGSSKSSMVGNFGTLTVSGGTLEQKTYVALINKPNAVLNITGGNINGDESGNSEVVLVYGTADVSGGKLTGHSISVYAYDDNPGKNSFGQIQSKLTVSGKAEIEVDEVRTVAWDLGGTGSNWPSHLPEIEITDDAQISGEVFVAKKVGNKGPESPVSKIPEGEKDETYGKITISGGIFDQDQKESYVVEGKELREEGGKYVVRVKRCAEHTYGEAAVTKEATCTEAGEKTSVCTVCGFELTEEIAALGHNWENGKCSRCGIECAHEYGEAVVTKEPTCTEAGEKTSTCGICGAKKTESAAALGHNWKDGTCTRCGLSHLSVTTEKIGTDGSVPSVQLVLAEEEVPDTLLENADQDRMENGASVQIHMTVEGLPGSRVPAADKKLMDDKAQSGKLKISNYLDINLYKIIDGEKTRITNTKKKVPVEIGIPSGLSASGYTFKVLRIHDGQITVLNCSKNSRKGMLTIETDRFSTYAVAYKKAASASSSSSGSTRTRRNEDPVPAPAPAAVTPASTAPAAGRTTVRPAAQAAGTETAEAETPEEAVSEENGQSEDADTSSETEEDAEERTVENPDEQTPLAPEPVIEGAGANRMLPVIPILIALLAAGFFFFLFLKRRKEKEEA